MKVSNLVLNKRVYKKSYLCDYIDWTSNFFLECLKKNSQFSCELRNILYPRLFEGYLFGQEFLSQIHDITG